MAEHNSNTHHSDETYHSHLGRYMASGLALFFFSALTYLCHIWISGPAALPVALLIAFVKAMIVILFFMHLYDHPGVNRIIMGTTLLLLVFGMLMVFADNTTRFPLSAPHF